MISDKFVILGALFNIAGSLGYVFATIKGRTRPNRVTWFLWALAPLIAFSAEIKEGVGLRSLMTFMVGFGPLLVFFSSFVNSKAKWQINKFDLVCGGLSLFGLILWLVTRHGNIAIAFSIAADGLAALPTIIKSAYHPETESYSAFLGGAISALITLFTVDVWSFANWGFPIYILLINIIFVALIKYKAGLKFNRATSSL